MANPQEGAQDLRPEHIRYVMLGCQPRRRYPRSVAPSEYKAPSYGNITNEERIARARRGVHLPEHPNEPLEGCALIVLGTEFYFLSPRVASADSTSETRSRASRAGLMQRERSPADSLDIRVIPGIRTYDVIFPLPSEREYDAAREPPRTQREVYRVTGVDGWSILSEEVVSTGYESVLEAEQTGELFTLCTEEAILSRLHRHFGTSFNPTPTSEDALDIMIYNLATGKSADDLPVPPA
jgi:hypothetical protein